MTRRAPIWLVAWSALLLPMATQADDLTGADRLLCTTVRASECFADGSCVEGEPEDWNVPRFMQIDLTAKTLSTTRASGEERSTPIRTLIREGGRVFIQGAQTSRAFSLAINQSSGLASAGIVLDGHVLNVFAYCTPLDSTD